MNKKIILLFISLLFLSGCSSKTNEAPPVLPERTQNSAFQGEAASIDDLKIGEKVVAFGSSNPDGSLSAATIMIGDMPRPAMDKRPTTDNAPQAGSQSASAEERQQRFAQMRNSGVTSNRRPTGGANRGGQSVRGEILEKTDLNLVVKIQDGGSKIVFYSNQTKIIKAPKIQEADPNVEVKP